MGAASLRRSTVYSQCQSAATSKVVKHYCALVSGAISNTMPLPFLPQIQEGHKTSNFHFLDLNQIQWDTVASDSVRWQKLPEKNRPIFPFTQMTWSTFISQFLLAHWEEYDRFNNFFFSRLIFSNFCQPDSTKASAPHIYYNLTSSSTVSVSIL